MNPSEEKKKEKKKEDVKVPNFDGSKKDLLKFFSDK